MADSPGYEPLPPTGGLQPPDTQPGSEMEPLSADVRAKPDGIVVLEPPIMSTLSGGTSSEAVVVGGRRTPLIVRGTP